MQSDLEINVPSVVTAKSSPVTTEITSRLSVTRERFSDLIPCTLFPQRPQYSEVPAAFCRLSSSSEFLRVLPSGTIKALGIVPRPGLSHPVASARSNKR